MQMILPKQLIIIVVPMFADDSKCYKKIEKPQDRNLLQTDLDSLHQWSLTWDLSFNASKCAAMRFSRKTSSEQPQEYHLNQQPIPFKITQKDLGILVSESLNWSSHINNLISKANKMLGFVQRNCFYLANVNCRRLLYLTLVRSQSLMALKSGRPRVHPLICYVLRVFNVAPRKLFCKTTSRLTRIA